MNTKLLNKGFTIIEVVLVIAIAGLIFLMVFIALPALQSGQRDQARKTDVGSIATATSNYTANNRGSFPTTSNLTGDPAGAPGAGGKFAGYASSVSNNITKITVGAAKAASATVAQGEIVVTPQTTCGASGAKQPSGSATQTLAAGTARQFTVTTFLEAGGGTSYCLDS